MRLVARVIVVLTALCFLGSSTLSAMPLVWCIGNDGHRAIEAILHQHSPQVADDKVREHAAAAAHNAPCSDWQLLGATGTTHVKAVEEAPKQIVVVIAFPSLRLIADAPAGHITGAEPRPPTAEANLRARRSVLLLI